MAAPCELVEALRLGPVQDEDEITDLISSLICSGVTVPSPRVSLQQIYGALSGTGSASLLDPLNVLPQLLPSRDNAAKDIITLMGEYSNAKELIIAIQEYVERLGSTLVSEQDEYDDEDEDNENSSSPIQLISLISLYTAAIPRLTLRKKTASETIVPLLSDLEPVIRLSTAHASKTEGRQLIADVSHLIIIIFNWIQEMTVVPTTDDEISKCQDILKSLLDTTLTSCSQHVDSSLAQRSFEVHFPRLSIRSVVQPGWEDGEQAVSDAINASKTIGFAPENPLRPASLSLLILLAHFIPPLTLSASHLSDILPLLLTSLQTNTALDESLSLLLYALFPIVSPPPDLSPEFLIPLIDTLSPLSSMHPSPQTRHITFRILALALSRLPPLARLQSLHSLASEAEFPQMRVASVGLVKEAVLEVLSPSSLLSSDTPPSDVFASPRLLQTLGPVLFRPSPPDLFEYPLTAEEFLGSESNEPQRLIECLSFYYVLLQRDIRNLTGIRDEDMLSNVEQGLLRPLREAVVKWMDDPSFTNGHMEDLMPLISLQMGLERVDSAVAAL